MRVGITSYGVYLPRYRIDTELLENIWGGSYGKGERAVPNYDEDSLTMASEAVLDCKEDLPSGETVGSLYFCSTSSPYQEKLASRILADIADFGCEIDTVDLSNSVRAGTLGLKAAVDSIRSGRSRCSLVVASDSRLGEPGSALESLIGNGAGALALGDRNPIATIEASYSISENFTDFWRMERDRFVKSDDARFVRSHGFMEITERAIRRIFSDFQLDAQSFSQVILACIDKSTQMQFAKRLGFDISKQVPSTIFDSVGNAGAAHSFLALISALETAGPGDTILFTNYGDGVDTFVLKVTEEIRSLQAKKKFLRSLLFKRKLVNYARYLVFRNLISRSPEPEPFSSLISQWREQKQNLGLYGTKCRECSSTYFPMRRICPSCGSQDKFDPVKISRRGKVHTFTRDRLFVCADPPLMMAVVDLADGARFYGQMTDCKEEEIDIDMPVELVLRKFHEAKGFVNYFWKARPSLQTE